MSPPVIWATCCSPSPFRRGGGASCRIAFAPTASRGRSTFCCTWSAGRRWISALSPSRRSPTSTLPRCRAWTTSISTWQATFCWWLPRCWRSRPKACCRASATRWPKSSRSWRQARRATSSLSVCWPTSSTRTLPARCTCASCPRDACIRARSGPTRAS